MLISFANEVLTLILSWFLDNPKLNWTPPKTLDDFMAKAHSNGKPLVYIGFGSITVPNPKLVTECLIWVVLKSMQPPILLSEPPLMLPFRWCMGDHLQRLVCTCFQVQGWRWRHVPWRVLFSRSSHLINAMFFIVTLMPSHLQLDWVPHEDICKYDICILCADRPTL